jgi:hypothetical protein
MTDITFFVDYKQPVEAQEPHLGHVECELVENELRDALMVHAHVWTDHSDQIRWFKRPVPLME